MSQNAMKPFDITLMDVSQNRLGRVPRILSAETYDGASTHLHDQGLFSTVLFGPIGSGQRDYTFGYIKLNTKIIHPIVAGWLRKLKRNYVSIWRGEMIAKFNPKTKDFEPADIGDGDTGYQFFISHLPDLKPPKSKSVKRNKMIDNLIKYKDLLLIDNFLVLPAGLRDIQVDQTGKVTEDEVNDYYRKLIRLSDSLANVPRTMGKEYDLIRLSMQETAVAATKYIEGLLVGKKGFLLGKWASRTLHLSSRNVISSQDSSVEYLGGSYSTDVDTVQMGLFQLMASSRPLVAHLVRSSDIMRVSFPVDSGYANLVEPSTLKRIQVKLDDEDIDGWMTLEGIDKQINKFSKPSVRTLPVMVRGHYVALIYKDEVKFQILSDIDSLPRGWDKSKVTPITYAELFYTTGYTKYNTLVAQCTRYPVIGDGSIFTGNVSLKTTIPSLKLIEYRKGEPLGDEFVADSFPAPGINNFLNTVSLSSTRLKGLDGDFDGDTVSSNPLFTEEAIEEAKMLNNKVKGIIGAGGKINYDIGSDIVVRAVNGMTVPSNANFKQRSRRGK